MAIYFASDVSSVRLDCAYIDVSTGAKEARKFANNQEGFEGLLKWAQSISGSQEIIIGFEATGAYSKPLQSFLNLMGIGMHVFNPRNIRHFAKGLGIELKNDKVDSYVICRALIMLCSKGTSVRSPFHERVRCVSRRICTLTTTRSEAKTRRRSPALSPEAKASLTREIKFFSEEIRTLEKEWLELIKQDSQLKKNYEMALSVEDIGAKTARVLTSELEADLSERTTKQISSYAGLAPHENSSGLGSVSSHISHSGNRFIKRAIYMPVTRKLMRECPEKKRYDAMKKAGKSHDQAIVPLMHTAIRQIAAVIKRGTPWSDDPPGLDKC